MLNPRDKPVMLRMKFFSRQLNLQWFCLILGKFPWIPKFIILKYRNSDYIRFLVVDLSLNDDRFQWVDEGKSS